MALKVNFDVKEKLNDSVWVVKASPHELKIFGNPHSHLNGPSILFTDKVRFNSDRSNIECSAVDVKAVNLGTSDYTILIETPTEDRINSIVENPLNTKQVQKKIRPQKSLSTNSMSNDRDFIKRLNNSTVGLRRIGTDLLSNIRKHYRGNLIYKHPRFVESPDNFWTITVQDQRTESLRITIYGKIDDFIQPPDITIKKDRGSYSAFIIDKYSQIESASRIILEAMKLKRDRW